MNEEFVFISDEGLPDRLGQAVRGLLQGCQLRGMMQIEAPFSTETASPRNFVKFLQGHIQQARNKGFDDNVSSSRHAPQHPPYFEVIYLKKKSFKRYKIFSDSQPPTLGRSMQSPLRHNYATRTSKVPLHRHKFL